MKLHSRPGDLQSLKALYAAQLQYQKLQLVTKGAPVDVSPLRTSTLALHDASIEGSSPVATEPNMIALYLGTCMHACMHACACEHILFVKWRQKKK